MEQNASQKTREETTKHGVSSMSPGRFGGHHLGEDAVLVGPYDNSQRYLYSKRIKIRRATHQPQVKRKQGG